MGPEHLKAELESKRDAGSILKRVGGFKQAVASLTGRGIPAPVRSLIEEIHTAKRGESWYGAQAAIDRASPTLGRALQSLTPADWKRMIAVLLPRIAPSAEAALAALIRRPFQSGFARKPFRAPRSATIAAQTRIGWLLKITFIVGEYDADIAWLAERAGSFESWWSGVELGWLFAGAIDVGGSTGEQVLGILTAVGRGEIPGQMGRHVTQALMSCDRPEAWDFVGKLLLSAQRQEGLRQTILESVDEAHPDAFVRIVRLVRDQDLARFSSVVRATDTWFGFLWDGASAVKVNSLLERILRFLDDPAEGKAALRGSDAEAAYLALWCLAFVDLQGAIEAAVPLLESPSVEFRFVATHLLAQSNLTPALRPLIDRLADPDLRVAARAMDMLGVGVATETDGPLLFARLEELIARVTTRSQNLGGLVWPWWSRKFERSSIAAALVANVDAVPGERLLPYVTLLEPTARAQFVRRAAGLRGRWEAGPSQPPRELTPAERTLVLALLGDPSADVREAAFAAIAALPVQSDEVDRLIELLGRTAGDLRSEALKRLRTLTDPNLLKAIDRLVADSEEPRRLAGLELIRDAREAGRLVEEAVDRAGRYQTTRTAVTDQERAHLSATLDSSPVVATREDALGLIDPGQLWVPPPAQRIECHLDSAAAAASLESLARLVLEHQGTEVPIAGGQVKLLIESVGWGGGWNHRADLDAIRAEMALQDVWRTWLRDRSVAQLDTDRCELLRALLAESASPTWNSESVRRLAGLGQHNAGARFLRAVAEWCLVTEPPARGMAFLIDGLEACIAGFSAADFDAMVSAQRAGRGMVRIYGQPDPIYRARVERATTWLRRIRWWRALFPATMTNALAIRLFGVLRSFEARSKGFDALRVDLEDFLAANRAGAVGHPDFLDLLAGRWSHVNQSSLLRKVSGRRPPQELATHPELIELIDRARRRIVAVEAERGDRQTAGSGLAIDLRWTGGLDTLARAIPALGKGHFSRTFGWNSEGASRRETLSHLVVRTIPREEDTPEAFASWATLAKVSEARLIELAVYAPQWARHVNAVVQWPGLESGVWWIESHTKDDRSWQLPEQKEIWAAEVSERTPLSPADLTEGAVDVAWFGQAFGHLGADRWKALDRAAKYAASAGGHTRAQLFSRAMAGLVTEEELVARIEKTRHQDSVRALGLLPLLLGELGRGQVLARFARLQEFRRTSRKFGSLRQTSEKRAVTIGLANLARAAGYRDPQRLQWAMERQAVEDLRHGPVVLVRGEVTLTLAIDPDGVASVVATKAGNQVKSLPAALKKDAEIKELLDRLKDLKRQQSRIRQSLEDAMNRGDAFEGRELLELVDHPILAPALSRLLFVGDDTAGYLAERGHALRGVSGSLAPIGLNETVRIAHPHDLLVRGDWSAWQGDCYRAERVQPFKQVFRELYPLTATERGTDRSRRFAGHQVNPRQALALLGGRGWIAHPEEGVNRTFHEEGLTARLAFQESYYTPADVEGLTIEEAFFSKKGDWKPIPLDQVPPRLFSEAMRDLDLVVSVAHRGGTDPEATASTVEMRAALVRETCQILGLTNVALQPNHAIVTGMLGTYSVHLGSAGVMIMPGVALPIVAVHSQHRGRLFLPFADDDPKSAEVLAKVLLLARDRQIADPTILERIRTASSGL